MAAHLLDENLRQHRVHDREFLSAIAGGPYSHRLARQTLGVGIALGEGFGAFDQ